MEPPVTAVDDVILSDGTQVKDRDDPGQATLFEVVDWPALRGPCRVELGGVELDRPGCHEVGPGLWAVVHYALSPKNGWPGRWAWPMFWSAEGHWNAPRRDGTVPDEALLWASEEDARFDLEANYPPGRPFRVGWLSFPSMDLRRKDQDP